MTSFLSQTQKFVAEFDDILEKKRAAWVKFVAAFPIQTVESSLGTYMARLPQAGDIYWLLAGVLQPKLIPKFSDVQTFRNTRYSRFNVWLLGATKGVELEYVRSFLEESFKNDDGCDVCLKNNRELHGHLSKMNISMMTALYIVFQSIAMAPSLIPEIEKLKVTVQENRNELKYWEDCQDGNCIEDDDDVSCRCSDALEAAYKEASKHARAFLDLLFEKSVSNADGYFQIGLEPYMVHQACSVDDEQGFSVMRQPADEAKEKARLAEEKREEDERKAKCERERLEKEIKRTQQTVEKSKKRLAELNNEAAKKKKSTRSQNI